MEFLTIRQLQPLLSQVLLTTLYYDELIHKIEKELL